MNAKPLVLTALAWGLLAPPAAALPASFTYQGNLWENGLPVTSTKTMSFRVTDPAGTLNYWTSGPLPVFVDRGHFAVQLSPSGVDWGTVSPRLEVTVGGVTLSPLGTLDAVPYSFVAGSVEGAVTLIPQGSAPTAARGRLYFDSNGAGALKVSLDGTTFVSVATGTGGSGGLATISSDAGQFSGDGSGGAPLTLRASSVTLQGNVFNGANQLLRLDAGGKLPALDGSQLTGVSDAARVLKGGDAMTGDLQVGGGAASTVSASGFVTMANLAVPPPATRGRLFFDSAGDGAFKVSLDGTSFVRLATGTAGAGLSLVAADAAQLSGDGTGGSPLTLKSSSVTLRGNSFNGANQLLLLDTAGKIPATVIASSIAAAAVDTVQLKDGGVTDAKIAGMSSSKLSGALPALNGSALTGVADATKVLKAGDAMTGDLQVGAAAASTVSASGFVTMANLAAPPAAARGRLFFDPAGDGAFKVSLDGASFVRLATGTAGAGLSSVAADAAQLSGDGTGGSPLTLKSSSATLQGNTFNGPGRLLLLDAAGKIPGTVIASSIAAAAVDTVQLKDGGVTDAKIAGMSSSKLSGALPALNGSALTGVNDVTKVLKAGDTMNGQLTISGSSLTVAGTAAVGAAALGGATLAVRSTSTTGGHPALSVQSSAGGGLLRVQQDGKVGIGTDAPGARLEVATPGGSSIQFDTSSPAYGSLKINGVEVARILP